ncbi:hypothetical protein ACWGH5_39265 [Streptomyces sp. NPDC054864]
MLKTIRSRRGAIGTGAALALLAAGAAGGVALADDAAVRAKAPHAQASAQINGDGTRNQSKGIQSVDRVAAGTYCVKFDDDTRIDVSRSTPVATLVADSRTPFLSILVTTKPSPACGNDADALTVYTGRPANNTPEDGSFMLLVP